MGGVNIYGDPWFRVVWGGSRLDWCGGLFEDRDPKTKELIRTSWEMRRVPLYLETDRWYFEIWVPAEKFCGPPEKWYADTKKVHPSIPFISMPGLGPYRSRGEYESVFTFEGPDGEFRQITPARVEFVAGIFRASRGLAREQMRSDRSKHDETKKAQRDRAMDNIIGTDGLFGKSTNTTSRDWLDITREERKRRNQKGELLA